MRVTLAGRAMVINVTNGASVLGVAQKERAAGRDILLRMDATETTVETRKPSAPGRAQAQVNQCRIDSLQVKRVNEAGEPIICISITIYAKKAYMPKVPNKERKLKKPQQKMAQNCYASSILIYINST